MTKKILMCGNEACGEGAVLAGCSLYAGYPITPQNELTAYMSKRMRETGGVFIQAESELAAINIVLGASAAGARAMTSSSSPGISLKQEGISYMAGMELPGVIVNVQRGGPGLGNIAPSQADYFQAVKGGGHGDYRVITLAPSSVQEMLDHTYLAFMLADKYRNPVFVLGDGLLGQMMEPVRLPNEPRTTSLETRKEWTLTGCKGRRPNIIRSLYLGDGVLEEHNKKLQQKYIRIREEEVRYEAVNIKDGSIIVVAYGTVARIAKAAVLNARAKGIKAALIRPVTLWPFPEKIIYEAALRTKKFLVVEMSSGQMVEDVMLALKGQAEVNFYGRMGGGIPGEEEILSRIEALA
jgi:2-oxoglutarate ferredoxin oxidoreductase subunit alpha